MKKLIFLIAALAVTVGAIGQNDSILDELKIEHAKVIEEWNKVVYYDFKDSERFWPKKVYVFDTKRGVIFSVVHTTKMRVEEAYQDFLTNISDSLHIDIKKSPTCFLEGDSEYELTAEISLDGRNKDGDIALIVGKL